MRPFPSRPNWRVRLRLLRWASSRGRRHWPILLLLLAAVLLPAVLSGALAWQERVALLREGELTATRTVAALAEHAHRVLETHALATELIESELRGRSWGEIQGNQDLQRILARITRQFPQIESAWLVDRDGELRLSNAAPGQSLQQLALDGEDMEFLKTHRGEGADRIFISAPSGGPDGTSRQFTVSSPRRAADGSFDGIVSVAVSVEFFTEFWKQFTPTVPHVIPLMKADGTMLVRYPAARHPPRLAPGSPFMQQIAARPAGGFYTAVSRVDGIERMNAYQRVGNYPLYVSFSIERQAWLAPWRERARAYALLTVLTMLALLAVAVMALRQALAQREAAHAWELAARRGEAEMRRRERLEAQLLQSQKMEAVGQLTGGVAHDFNNLLHAMSLNVHMAERFSADGKLSSCLANIRRSVERATELTRQLTAFSRRQALAPRSFAPAGLIVQMADLLNRTLGGKIAIDLDVGPDVFNVFSDPGQTELAILNLAVNARDAMPEGGRLGIHIRNLRLGEHPELPSGDYVEISISDTGSGMPPEVAARAFEPFFTTKQVGKGTGLGLSMVHGFARQSGGTATIESRAGHGTTVRLLLPRGQAEAEPAAPSGPSHAVLSRLGGRVLLVDDDSLVRSAMLLALTAAGYSVEAAAGGAEALQLLGRNPPDILVTDYAMPGMNGLELAALAASMHAELPIVLVTGYAEPAVGPETLHVDRILIKPFTDAELVELIESLLWAGADAGKPA